MKKMQSKLPAIIFLFILSVLTISGCGRNNSAVVRTGFAFDTIISVSLYGDNAENAANGLMVEAARLDNLWNKNKQTSEIYMINHSCGEPTEVSPETFALIKEALKFAKESDGAFDPTIGSLTSLWDFKADEPVLPSDNSIKAALNTVSYEYIILKENSGNSFGGTVTITNPSTQIDVGAIAKGYAGDILAKYCHDNNINNGFINLGGNVIVLGPKPGSNDPINVGIKNPIPGDNGTTPYTSVPVSEGCVVTSGLYERGFELDGEYYHHILNTKTGYPVKNNLLSVSVIGPSSITCDALSTILYIKGIEEGLEFIGNYPDYNVIFINDKLESVTK